MNGRTFLLLGGLFAMPLVAGPCLADGPLFVPLPYVLKVKAIVDGAQLTGVDLSYSIKVKSLDGTEFQPVDAPGGAFGKVTPSRFQYNIPTYGAHDQPGGAKDGQKACIEIYHGATRLTVTYPGRGSCPGRERRDHGIEPRRRRRLRDQRTAQRRLALLCCRRGNHALGPGPLNGRPPGSPSGPGEMSPTHGGQGGLFRPPAVRLQYPRITLSRGHESHSTDRHANL